MTLYAGRAALITAIDAVINDNSAGDISPADVRSSLDNLALNAVFPEDMPLFIRGLITTNSAVDATNDIVVSAGAAMDSTGQYKLVLAAAITKQLDVAWAVGTNQGARDTGAISNAWWYVWLIMRPDTGVVDVLMSLSSTAPTMPANYTLKRLIGAMERTAGSTLRAVLSWEGDGGSRIVKYVSDLQDKSGTNTSDTDVTLTTPAYRTKAHLDLRATRTGGAATMRVYEKGLNTPALPTIEDTATNGTVSGRAEVWTDASAVIRYVVNNSSTTGVIQTTGYTDPRIQ